MISIVMIVLPVAMRHCLNINRWPKIQNEVCVKSSLNKTEYTGGITPPPP